MLRIIALFLFTNLFHIVNAQVIDINNPLFTTDSLMQSVESPKWSPDSKKLVFSGFVNGKWKIFLYDLQEDSITNTTFSGFNKRNPVWHPDGSSIVYDKIDNGIPKLFIHNTHSNEDRILINRDIKCSQASFSNSGNLVCFLGFDEINENWQVYTYDFTYDNLNLLTHHKTSCNNPNFSPDGKHILYELISESLDTTLKMVNWYGNPELSLDSLEAYSSSWDEKSWRFHFLSRNGKSETEIYSLRRNGDHLVQLTDNNILEKDFTQSPNGKYAALIISVNKRNRLVIVEMPQ